MIVVVNVVLRDQFRGDEVSLLVYERVLWHWPTLLLLERYQAPWRRSQHRIGHQYRRAS